MTSFGRKARTRAGVAILGLALAAGLAVWAKKRQPPPPLPVYGTVTDFQLVDASDRPFTQASMLGHVSVVDFIFTRCQASCPKLTAAMGELQARLAQDSSVRLVSFSVDPENDTPAVLSAYAAKAHADPARWSFVTGPYEAVSRAVVQGFKVSLAKVAREASDYDVIHGNWFVLVDPRGRIRGYYETADPGWRDVVLSALASLARES